MIFVFSCKACGCASIYETRRAFLTKLMCAVCKKTTRFKPKRSVVELEDSFINHSWKKRK